MKQIALLGSTGSIGRQTLQVVCHLQSDIEVVALAAHRNIDLLEKQFYQFKPKLIAVYDIDKAKELQKRLPQASIIPGMEGLEAVASHEKVELVIAAMSNTIGLIPTISAIKAGKAIALANKEVLVAGGQLIQELAKKHSTPLIPIDSEHSAIFQCLQGQDIKSVRRLILTASGGPFRSYTKEQFSSITVKQTLRHPTWNMGPKITVDSSTLMNKGLEVIEAHWLFNMDPAKIEVIIHPQSIIHSMVEYSDYSICAQMSVPNMSLPIQYALTYPKRMSGVSEVLDFTKYSTLEFAKPDEDKFPCLKLAYEALRMGKSAPCYLNAANEELVKFFLDEKISWMSIAGILEDLLSIHKVTSVEQIEDILEVDAQARRDAAAYRFKENR